MSDRITYLLCHRWMRKLLAAGQPLPSAPPRMGGQAWHAARAAISSRCSPSCSVVSTRAQPSEGCQ